jgi:polysaccharide pyruvyl transferase WcaK-like protein
VKILIESGTYDMLNLGDVAMLQIGLERMRKRWPNADLRLVTMTPELLPTYAPGTTAISDPFFSGRKQWLEQYNLLGPWHRLIGGNAPIFERGMRTKYPRWAARRIAKRFRRRGVDSGPVDFFHRTVYESDAMIVTGGGFMTDAFLDYNTWLAETAALASGLGKPVGFFGQGLGPLESAQLRLRSSEAYANARLIGIREAGVTRQFLKDAGVDASKVRVTGDDAIELARRAAPTSMGYAIGVNLRTTQYSNLGREHAERLRLCVTRFAAECGAPLLPIVISRYSGTDIDTLAEIFPDTEGIRELALQQDTPAKVIDQISRCRVVVTGSYHAGVFGLSQGVPMIGLAKSEYYAGKFGGLVEQFGKGSAVLSFDDADFERKLTELLRALWNSADDTRGSLLATADKQVELSRAAWLEYFALVETELGRK